MTGRRIHSSPAEAVRERVRETAHLPELTVRLDRKLASTFLVDEASGSRGRGRSLQLTLRTPPPPFS